MGNGNPRIHLSLLGSRLNENKCHQQQGSQANWNHHEVTENEMGGSEWSNKPRFIQEDEICGTKNETRQTPKGQSSTRLAVPFIREEL